MRFMPKLAVCVVLLLGLPACTTLDADMIKALAADSASFCARSGVAGGAGGDLFYFSAFSKNPLCAAGDDPSF